MDKPIETTKSAIDWNEAKLFIEEKLGLHDLRDTLGMFKDGHNVNVEYRDYWHLLCDNCEISNGGTIFIESHLLGAEPWQDEITQAIIDEFGDECEFWTEW